MGVREEKKKEGWKGRREKGKEGGREGGRKKKKEGGRKKWEGEQFAKVHLAFLWSLLGTMEAERTTERFQ